MLHEAPPTFGETDLGRIVSIGRHRLYVETAGTGTPVVVFEPGLGGNARDWTEIHAAVVAAGFAAVAYDRAGHGRSSPARDARHSDQIAGDLQALLRLVAAPPFVLVGHSLGGLHVRAFAQRAPDLVAGMVLIESSHMRQERPAPPRAGARLREMARLALRRPRAGGSAERQDPRSFERELRAFARCAGEPEPLSAGALGDKPLAVLTAARPVEEGEGDSWEAWHALHADLARISRNSAHIVAREGGHDLHRDAPDLVVAAILAVCRAARDDGPLALG